MQNNQHQEIVQIINNLTMLDYPIVKNLYRLYVQPPNNSDIIGGGGDCTGTGFTIIRSREIYLVTAAHLFKGLHIDDVPNSILIQHEAKFEGNKVEIIDFKIGNCNNAEEDIAVFKVKSTSLCREFNFDDEVDPFSKYEIKTREDMVYIGQQIIFAGYPTLNNALDYNDKVNIAHEGFPRPFLKFGYLSHFTGTPPRYYIDGAPNRGFSGGPIMYRVEDGSLRYLGVVSQGSNDSGLGGFTMICGKIDTVDQFIDEIEKKTQSRTLK